MFNKSETHFYGSGIVSEKGQIVIPSEARTQLQIEPGEKFIFFGHGQIIHLVKANKINDILDKLTQKFTQNISEIKAKSNKLMK